MEEKRHQNPVATKIHSKSDEQFKPFNPQYKPQKRSSKCLVHTLLIIVILSIAFLILGLVALRVKSPTLRLSQIAIIRDLKYDAVLLNTTMIVEIRLHNMNYGVFEFHGANTTLFYETGPVGMGNINEGRVGIKENKCMNVTIKVIMGSNYENYNMNNFSRDVNLGLVKMRSYAKLRGEVRVMKIFTRHRIAVMNCFMALNLTSQLLQDLSCV